MKIRTITPTRPIITPSYPGAKIGDYCLTCENYKIDDKKEYCKINGKNCFRFLKGRFTNWEEECETCHRKKDGGSVCWWCGN